MVRDVHTGWNYPHAMIRRAELLQEVSLPFTSDECPGQLTSYSFNQAIDDWVFKTPGLRALLLTEYDWEILRGIADVLEVRMLSTYCLPSFKAPPKLALRTPSFLASACSFQRQ